MRVSEKETESDVLFLIKFTMKSGTFLPHRGRLFRQVHDSQSIKQLEMEKLLTVESLLKKGLGQFV